MEEDKEFLHQRFWQIREYFQAYEKLYYPKLPFIQAVKLVPEIA